MPGDGEDKQLTALRKADVVASIAISAVTLYYLVDVLVDSTTKEIWKRQARAWWERTFPCCEDCAEERRLARQTVWEAVAVVSDLPLPPPAHDPLEGQ